MSEKQANTTQQAVQAKVIKFDASAVAATPNFFREQKADREKRASALLSKPLTFLSRVGSYANDLASGNTLDVAGNKINTSNLDSLRCVICHGIHGMPTKAEQAAGDSTWNAKRLALIGLFLASDGKLVVVSETCQREYILPRADKGLTNPQDFRRLYALPKKPRAS